eukprot:TRINITY_DN15916_c0_g1_i3.p2 TRINITY_DN15916_c0_g1~~TRINITY_DN15916_c0_g1_i3.p2  ORF type:complete len:129 (-),score=35.74 TRINITY_DN15916_c0_g1_i3:69-455(-)
MIDEISNEQLLQQMQEIRSSINTESVQKASEPGQLDQEFGQVLDKLITDVDQAQKEADMSIQQLATGETTSIQDVVMKIEQADVCLLYTSDAADDTPCVDLGGRRIIKKKKIQKQDTSSGSRQNTQSE